MYHNYTYVVFDISEIDQINNIYNVNSLRWNESKTKCLVKFLGDCPSWCANKPLYNKKNILNILKSW